MAPRANWKGFLKIGEVTCPVALYTAFSTSERIAFHTLNRATGHRVNRRFIDSDTGKPVERDDQVKGYEMSSGEYILLEPDEIAAAIPGSDKTLDISAFIAMTVTGVAIEHMEAKFLIFGCCRRHGNRAGYEGQFKYPFQNERGAIV